MTLPQLPDLDLQMGLQHCMGKESIYLRVLKAFREHEIDFGAELRAALRLGRRDDALRLAHGLRSSAASIGATALGEIAHQIELAVKQGDADDKALDLLETLEPRLRALVQGLKDTLPP